MTNSWDSRLVSVFIRELWYRGSSPNHHCTDSGSKWRHKHQYEIFLASLLYNVRIWRHIVRLHTKSSSSSCGAAVLIPMRHVFTNPGSDVAVNHDVSFFFHSIKETKLTRKTDIWTSVWWELPKMIETIFGKKMIWHILWRYAIY